MTNKTNKTERAGETVSSAFTKALAERFGFQKRLVLNVDETSRLHSIEYWANLHREADKVRAIAWDVPQGQANFTYWDSWSGKWSVGKAPVEWLVQAKANCLPHVAEQIVCSLCSGGAR